MIPDSSNSVKRNLNSAKTGTFIEYADKDLQTAHSGVTTTTAIKLIKATVFLKNSTINWFVNNNQGAPSAGIYVRRLKYDLPAGFTSYSVSKDAPALCTSV
jgi:hypothetical protein